MKVFSKNLSRGFTLIELLIALTLLGLVMTILYGALRVGIRSWEAGEKQAVEMDDRRQILGFLRRELSQAYPLTWQRQGKQRVAFAGGPDSLQFAAILPAHRGVGGLYLLSVGKSGGQLVFSYQLMQPGVQDHQAGGKENKETRVVLISALRQAEFSYYGRQGKGEDKDQRPRWWSQWKDPDRLPTLVRLRLAALDPWPDLLVPLHAEVHLDKPQLMLKSPESAGLGPSSEEGSFNEFGGDLDDEVIE